VTLFSFFSSFMLFGAGMPSTAMLVGIIFGVGYLFAALALAQSESLTDYLEARAEIQLQKGRQRGAKILKRFVR